MQQTDKNPQLDERLWQAWIQKHSARDKLRHARRLRIIRVLAVVLVVIALYWLSITEQAAAHARWYESLMSYSL
jgi:hypothetical protein